MLVLSLSGAYQTAQAAEIVAGYTALEVIEGILLSFGISLFTTEMVSTLTEDPQAAQDEYWRETQAAFWADQMEAEYESQRKKSGGGSGPTPTPGVTSTDIPSFKEVIQNMKNTGKIVLGAAAGAGVWECMSKAVSSLWDKMIGRTNVDIDSSNIDEDALNILSQSGFAYYQYRPDPYNQIRKYKEGSFYVIGSGWYRVAGTEYYSKDKNGVWKLVDTISKDGYVAGEYQNIGLTNIPQFTNYADGIEWSKKIRANADKYTKENIWVHPDLQDTYKNNGKLEYPQQAPQPLQIPSIDQLTELAKKLKSDPEQAPNAVQDLIDQLKQNSNPQPTTAPNPNPNPQPTTIPNPTISPGDTDTDTDTDVDPDKYKTDLRLVFPFCIPFDLVHLIQAFEAEPEAPVFEIPFDLELENPFTGKKALDYHHTFKLDMSDYESVIKIFRIFEIIFFIIGLLMITRQQMIKG